MNRVLIPTFAAAVMALAHAFSEPSANADILVSDFNNSRVLRFTDSGALLGTFGDADAAHSGISTPGAITMDTAGRVYVCSQSTSQILRYGPSGNFLGSLVNLPNAGPLRGLDFDHQGNLYTRQGGTSSSILVINPSGTIIQSFSTGNFWNGDIAIDANDVLYVPRDDAANVLDNSLDGIYRYSMTGAPLGYFGQATYPSSGVYDPQSSVFDAAGNLYVSAYGQIRRYSPNGAYLGLFVNDPPGPTEDLAIDSTGNIYAVDAYERGVMKFDGQGNSFGKIINAGQGGLPSNFRPDGIGFITVPEPAAWTLLIIGIVGFYLTARRLGWSKLLQCISASPSATCFG